MTASDALYAVPAQFEPGLQGVLAYWEGLKRGDNAIPFADDVKPDALAGHGRDPFMIDVFADPLRFRFAIVGPGFASRYGGDLAGRFLDEMVERAPIDQLNAQCHVTAMRGAPTYFRSAAQGGGGAYARLLLPLWGNGHIQMLLGGLAPAA